MTRPGTPADSTAQTALWGGPDSADRPARRLRPAPPPCALCAAQSAATPFGLCAGCLAGAAAELARLSPRPADPDDPRPAAIGFRDLCRRCGSHRHPTSGCAA